MKCDAVVDRDFAQQLSLQSGSQVSIQDGRQSKSATNLLEFDDMATGMDGTRVDDPDSLSEDEEDVFFFFEVPFGFDFRWDEEEC